MNKKALLAILLSVAVSGCGVQTVSPNVAPVPSVLYSEFKVQHDSDSIYGAFLAATQAQHDANYSKSADYFLEALAADPESKYVADRAFFQLLYGGRTERAAELAAQIAKGGFKEDDDLVRLMHVLGAYKAGDWPGVRTRLENGPLSGFGFLISPLLRAWSYGGEGDMDAAKLALVPLFEDKQLKSIAEEHTAYILDYAERYDEAETQYVLLTQSNPPVSLQPAIAYADMLYREGKGAKARTFLGEQLRRFKNHNFLLREGSLITKGKRPSQLAATPNGAAGMIFFRLATEFAQGKSLQAAVLYARIASYLTPEVSDVHFLLGELLEQEGNTDAAAAAYNNVPVGSIMRRLADIRRINVLRTGGRTDLAEELIRNRLRQSPRDVGMLQSLANILQQREAFEESIGFYNKAIEAISKTRANNWRIYFSRAMSYEGLENWEMAEKDLQQALKISPDQPAVLNYLGYTWIEKGLHIAEAKRMIETAAAARPDDGFIIDSLGWVYYLTGDYEGSVEVLEKAVRLEPDDVTINTHLGDAYWQVERKIEARFQWRHAIDSGAEGEELAELLKKLEVGVMVPS